ncbi:hypothetical protein OBBRIDRAFT_422018 [Obba rivulosa]|uniref:Uncharacterized protein n=1 Tax=Obba rivulosa TaxID=1052685 RepID=A0A8E2AXY6_9APHY|nr:hypothetical protein OBBRIDRAFT_422018 [Obba rivulosa]
MRLDPSRGLPVERTSELQSPQPFYVMRRLACRGLLILNVVNIVGWSTNSFVFAVEDFTTPLSSIIVSHFLMNLRQAAISSRGETLDQFHPGGQIDSSRSNIRFPSFIDNMGEPLAHGRDVHEQETDTPERLEALKDQSVSVIQSRGGGL